MTTSLNVNNIVPDTQVIDIPSGLISYLEKRGKRTSMVIKNRYSVTDLVGCQRKCYYKSCGIEEENLLNDAAVENLWDSVRGDLLHQITYAYRWREMDIEHNVILSGGKRVTVAGRLDMYDWKSATIIDLKTTKFVKWQIKQGFIPKPDHVLQLQCYYLLFSTILPVRNLNIVYVDMSDIVTYEVQKRDISEWMRIRLQRLENCLISNEVPTGEVSGVCKYCKYQTRCYNDGNGLTSKPLSIPD